MTFTLSPDRMNRLNFHLKRWKGPISVAMQLDEEELRTVSQRISKINRNDIRFTLYIVKKAKKNTQRCSFIAMNGTCVLYDRCFVINELRNLVIETIQTTHFMLIDGDSIISSIYFVLLLLYRYHV